MTLTISLPSQTEAKLRERAQAVGQDVTRYAEQLLIAELGGKGTPGESAGDSSNRTTLDLFEQWERSQHTDDPAELARRQREGEELMENLDRNRREMEGPEARRLWP